MSVSCYYRNAKALTYSIKSKSLFVMNNVDNILTCVLSRLTLSMMQAGYFEDISQTRARARVLAPQLGAMVNTCFNIRCIRWLHPCGVVFCTLIRSHDFHYSLNTSTSSTSPPLPPFNPASNEPENYHHFPSDDTYIYNLTSAKSAANYVKQRFTSLDK